MVMVRTCDASLTMALDVALLSTSSPFIGPVLARGSIWFAGQSATAAAPCAWFVEVSPLPERARSRPIAGSTLFESENCPFAIQMAPKPPQRAGRRLQAEFRPRRQARLSKRGITVALASSPPAGRRWSVPIMPPQRRRARFMELDTGVNSADARGQR